MRTMDSQWSWVEQYDLGFCLLFARCVSLVDVLAAYGCDSSSARLLTWEEMVEDEELGDIWGDPDCAPVVRVGQAGDWAFGFEALGIEGGRPETARQLPAGTETVSLCVAGNAFSWFRYAIGGVAVTEFEPLISNERRGTEPDRLARHMGEVGLNPDRRLDLETVNPTVAALDLATAVWGLSISEGTVNGPLLSAQTHPWPREAAPTQHVKLPAALLEPGRPGPAGSVMQVPPRPS